MNVIDKEKLMKDLRKAVDEAQEKAGDIKSDIKSEAEVAYEQAKQKAMDARYQADKYIKDNPERAMLISVGVGAVIGLAIVMLLKHKGKCGNCRE